MDDRKWERAAGFGGILFVLLIIVTVVLSGEPPTTSDRPGEVAKYFADHLDEIRYTGVIGVVMALPLVWWGASVYRMIERATGNARLGVMAVVGLAVGVTAGALSSVILAAAAIDAAALGPGGLRFFYLVASNLNGVLGIGGALVSAAIAVAVIRTGVLPKWFGWYAAVASLFQTLMALTVGSTRDAVAGVGFIGLISFPVLVLVLSIFMLQGRTTGETAQ